MSNKASKRLVPDLRFPEFRDAEEWKQRLIEDFFDVGSSKRVLQQDWTTQGIPFYRTRELVSLSKNKPFGSEIFISKELFREISERYGLPAEGDFLVSGVGTLGISYQVQAQDKFYFKDGNVLWFRLKGGIISTFFKYCFEADEIQKQILGQASISTVGTYTIQNAKVTKFFCPPSTEEQQQIAACLSSIDDLIAAQAKKIEALKAHKNGLMQQLFPAEGETIPRLRFPEFRDAGEWKKKKISDVLMEAVRPLEMEDDEEYSLVLVKRRYEGIVSRGKLQGKSIKVKSQFFLQKDDFLISKRQIVHCACGLVPDEFDGAIVSNEYSVLRAKNGFCIKFFKYFCQQPMVGRSFLECSIGVVIEKMLFKINDWLKREFLFPSLDEQVRIANHFSSIEELIAAQDQMVNALKTHKHGLMQQLFPVMDEMQT